MLQPSNRAVAVVVNSVTLLLCVFCSTASAQQHRGAIFADVGFASIGHADSEQGKTPLVGGGASFRLTPWLVAEGDVHRAHVSHVFGRDDHDFTEWTATGSLLFRAFARVALTYSQGVDWRCNVLTLNSMFHQWDTLSAARQSAWFTAAPGSSGTRRIGS